MAISKERKQEILSQYSKWMEDSKAVVITEYTGLTMKNLDALRAKMREVGGEFHIVKNTLGKLAVQEAGFELNEDWFEGSTAIGFGFQDAPAVAKVVVDFAKESEFVKIKGGFLGPKAVNADSIKALADLPPLPVMRAQLLGTIMAPASKLVRTLAEPGRQVAAVVKAYADADGASASA